MTFQQFKEKINIEINQIYEAEGYRNYYATPHKQLNYWDNRDKEKQKEADIENAILDENGWVGTLTSESGADGGNCWGDNAEEFYRDSTPFPFLEKILETTAPNISLVNFTKIKEALLKNGDYTNSEWYGNYTDYCFIWLNLKDLYEKLVEIGEIIPTKAAVIIGGLPLSGKTTLAKGAYPDYFLIDDPKDYQLDISPHLCKDKIVITDPHLSFKKGRESLKKILIDNKFNVHEIILDVHKNTLFDRANKEGKKDRVEFIKNFKVEK